MKEIGKILVNGANAYCKDANAVTSGMVGATVNFEFDSSWDGLDKTAVFRAGSVTKIVVGIGDTVEIPHEVLAKPMRTLLVGVYGTDSEGTLVIPTVYATIGSIFPGAKPSGDPSADPTLPPWVDLQKQVDELKRNPGGEISPEAVEKAVEGYLSENPPAQGEPGKTPEKYVDYFTPEDVQEIAEAAAGLVEIPDTYSKTEIDAIMGAYIADIDTLVGGGA